MHQVVWPSAKNGDTAWSTLNCASTSVIDTVIMKRVVIEDNFKKNMFIPFIQVYE